MHHGSVCGQGIKAFCNSLPHGDSSHYLSEILNELNELYIYTYIFIILYYILLLLYIIIEFSSYYYASPSTSELPVGDL